MYAPMMPETQPPVDPKSKLEDKLIELLSGPRTQLVMAPERKITPFDGKPGEVRDFLSSIKDAFQPYSIPVGQRGSFLKDYLRGVPKLEVKALLADGQSVGEALDFLKDSYGEKLAVGELQRLFLERRQHPGENVRDFAVDLERRFLRLTRKDSKLYASPNSALTEQFIEGLGDTYMRNTCRDMYERGTITSFRELREYGIRREGQEEARGRAVDATRVQQSTIQLSKSNSEDILGAEREMSELVVQAVREIARPAACSAPMPRPRQNPHPSDFQNSVYPRTGRYGPCYSCGYSGHFARTCPYKGMTGGGGVGKSQMPYPQSVGNAPDPYPVSRRDPQPTASVQSPVLNSNPPL